MKNMKIDIVNNYVRAINSGSIDKICDMETEDYVFIDAHDNRVVGIENMRKAWSKYFEMFPDYNIEINETIVKDSMVCLFGYASGTYKNLKNEKNSNFWRIPAAWTAIVKKNKISQWQVYADNIIVMEIINRNQNK
jgi:ketosteroid isomerase-like protein